MHEPTRLAACKQLGLDPAHYDLFIMSKSMDYQDGEESDKGYSIIPNIQLPTGFIFCGLQPHKIGMAPIYGIIDCREPEGVTFYALKLHNTGDPAPGDRRHWEPDYEKQALREALLYCRRLIREALPKFNWGASFLDAKAIQLLNEVPIAVDRALDHGETVEVGFDSAVLSYKLVAQSGYECVGEFPCVSAKQYERMMAVLHGGE